MMHPCIIAIHTKTLHTLKQQNKCYILKLNKPFATSGLKPRRGGESKTHASASEPAGSFLPSFWWGSWIRWPAPALGDSWAPLSPSIQVSYTRTTAMTSANVLIPSPSEGELNQTLFTFHSTVVDNCRSKCNFIGVLLLMVKYLPSNFVSTVVKTECLTILLRRNIYIQHDASLQRLCHWNTSTYQIIRHTQDVSHTIYVLFYRKAPCWAYYVFLLLLKVGCWKYFLALGFIYHFYKNKI